MKIKLEYLQKLKAKEINVHSKDMYILHTYIGSSMIELICIYERGWVITNYRYCTIETAGGGGWPPDSSLCMFLVIFHNFHYVILYHNYIYLILMLF